MIRYTTALTRDPSRRTYAVEVHDDTLKRHVLIGYVTGVDAGSQTLWGSSTSSVITLRTRYPYRTRAEAAAALIAAQ